MPGRSHTPLVSSYRIGVILAGGRSRRMRGDKARVLLAGRPLIDHVLARLAPQVDQMLIAGADDYGTAITAVPDRADGPSGPVAGLWSAAHWIADNVPDAAGFVTAPVDGPFLPPDLFSALTARSGCAAATNDEGLHPTFAYWEIDPLLQALTAVVVGKGPPLRAMVHALGAHQVRFEAGRPLMNINTPEDLARAESLADPSP